MIKRIAAKRDLTDHFVFLGENASVEVARRFLRAANMTFQSLAKMSELGVQRNFRNPRFSIRPRLAHKRLRTLSRLLPPIC